MFDDKDRGGQLDGLALETSQTGPELADVLGGIDLGRASGYELIRTISAVHRQVNHYQALFYFAVAELARLDVPEPDSVVPSELAGALHLTRVASEAEYWLAIELAERPALLDALADSSLDLRRVKVILHQLRSLPDEQAKIALEEVLPKVPLLTTGQIRALLRKRVVALAPEIAEREYRDGLERRRIFVEANPDGTANLLVMNAPPTEVNSARARIEQVARALRGAGEERTIDQLRADVALDILNCGTGAGEGRAVVDIVVDLPTLAGLSEMPGEIPGFGPVIAEVARKTALDQTDCRWEFTVTDQGQPVATGTISRRPTRGQGRQIRARYRTCVFPGCRQPARHTDLDHTRAWVDRGATSIDNLAPVCRYHHRLKDRGWSYLRDSHGSIVWTSPTGHTYIAVRPP